MTRNQFLTDTRRMMKELRPNLNERSARNIERKLRLISKILYQMSEDNVIKTCSPRDLGPRDISAYVRYRRTYGVADSTINKEISMMNKVLTFVGNNAVQSFRVTAGNSLPHKYTGRKPPIDDAVVEKIYRLARRTWNWELLEGCMALVFSISTGIRAEESRIFDIDGIHLNGDRSYVWIEKVKGAGTYGLPRIAPIMDGAEDIFEKYLKERGHRVDVCRYGGNAMFPNLRYPDRVYLSQQSFNALKRPVEDALGERLEIRAGRRSFGQRALDNGQDLSDISVAMGHMSTKTTERYYCRLGNEKAVENMFRKKNGG